MQEYLIPFLIGYALYWVHVSILKIYNYLETKYYRGQSKKILARHEKVLKDFDAIIDRLEFDQKRIGILKSDMRDLKSAVRMVLCDNKSDYISNSLEQEYNGVVFYVIN